MLNGKNSAIFSKNSGKKLRISKNSRTFAVEKQRQRRIASLKGADKTVKRAACNVGIAHSSDGAGDKTVKWLRVRFTTRPPRFYFDKLTNKIIQS